MKKEVKRLCLITKESKDVKDLVRFTLLDGALVVDPTHKLGGRGYYISKDIEVINKAKEKNLISKILKVNVTSDFYDELLKYVR
ncbi:MAG: YlxR family protein [Coprobacillus sp.]|nr:YlxR family protein [Coprobacillus sp.]